MSTRRCRPTCPGCRPTTRTSPSSTPSATAGTSWPSWSGWLTLDECLAPGYYRDPDWTVRDLVAHLGTWLAEAEIQFQRIQTGTYQGHDIDVDALNEHFAAAMRDQPWDVVWIQANAARSTMVRDWHEIREPTDEAAWWMRKSGVDHYTEHLGRLHEWVAELVARADYELGAASRPRRATAT